MNIVGGQNSNYYYYHHIVSNKACSSTTMMTRLSKSTQNLTRLGMSTATTLVQATVTSFNSSLTGLLAPTRPSIFNLTTGMISLKYKSNYVTGLFKALLWLRISHVVIAKALPRPKRPCLLWLYLPLSYYLLSLSARFTLLCAASPSTSNIFLICLHYSLFKISVCCTFPQC